ncbi:hypothetical protein [Rufibacter roseolus]|uniref:hypothetical protein n=1 Tax=Rufibacter roseolus TaxID=2817375 RepID=UPI001B308331|nr:hypothetical protein [Rufibacter roseolus]
MPLPFLLLCCIGSFAAHARQKNKDKEKSAAPNQTYRVELKSNSFDDDHRVHVLPDSALFLVSLPRHAGFGHQDFVLTKYDRQLKPIWESKYAHDPNHHLIDVASDSRKMYLLFSTKSYQKLVLYQVDAATGKATHSEHSLPSIFIYIRGIAAVDGQVFLNGLEKENLRMLHLNPQEEEIKLLPSVLGLKDDLAEFRVDTLSRTMEFVVAESDGLHPRVQARRMNPQGGIIGTYFFQPKPEERTDNTLQTGLLTPGDTLGKLLIGSYGYRSSRFLRGLFTGDLKGNLKYYDLSKLSHFLEYLSPRAQRRMKARFAQEEAKGKPWTYPYQLLLHPILPHPLGYAVIAEVYHKQFGHDKYYTSRATNPVYAPVADARPMMFDGYRFTHAIACVFDREGNLLWDNSYKLKNITYPELTPTVEASISPEGNITMAYPDEKYVWYKTLKQDQSISDEEKVAVRLQEETEKRVASSHEGLAHWYGNNFIAFGFQRIKPKKGSSRTVFYLQNMAF